MATGERHSAAEVGVLKPRIQPVEGSDVARSGIVITGVKELDRIRVGDTIATDPSVEPLAWIRRTEADGVLRVVSVRRRRFRATQGGAREAPAQRHVVSCGNRRAHELSGSDSGAAFSDSFTWRSFASGSSESTDSTSLRPPRRWPIASR